MENYKKKLLEEELYNMFESDDSDNETSSLQARLEDIELLVIPPIQPRQDILDTQQDTDILPDTQSIKDTPLYLNTLPNTLPNTQQDTQPHTDSEQLIQQIETLDNNPIQPLPDKHILRINFIKEMYPQYDEDVINIIYNYNNCNIDKTVQNLMKMNEEYDIDIIIQKYLEDKKTQFITKCLEDNKSNTSKKKKRWGSNKYMKL